MNDKERSRLKRFLESPWGKVALGAGAVGVIGLTAAALLRIRRHSRTQALELKLAARSSAKTKDNTPRLIEGADALARAVGPQVGEVAAELTPMVDPRTGEALLALGALSSQSK